MSYLTSLISSFNIYFKLRRLSLHPIMSVQNLFLRLTFNLIISEHSSTILVSKWKFSCRKIYSLIFLSFPSHPKFTGKKKRKKEKKSRTQHLIFISCETDRTFKLQPNRNQYFSRKDSGEFSDHFFRDGKRMRYYPTLCHSHTLTASPTFSAARTPASYPATCRSALQTSNLRLILRNQ